MALNLETLDVLYELPRHPGITQQIVDAVGEAIAELATTYALLEKLAALKTDAALGAAVRRMPLDRLLWNSCYGDWRVARYPRDVGEMLGYGAAPDEALVDAGLLEAE